MEIRLLFSECCCCFWRISRFHCYETINKEGKYDVGKAISGLENINESGVHIFHAGTTLKDGNLVTSGGRVLAGISSSYAIIILVTAVTPVLTKSIELAYSSINKVKFDGIHFRKDIAARALKEKVVFKNE